MRGRALVVEKLSMLPVECVVRGYITGSGWKDYQATGTVSGLELPPGLQESEQLPEPLYTPSTKAEVGHDEAIDFEQTVELLGGDRALAEQRARRLDRAVRDGRRARALARRDPRRHEVRAGPRRRRRRWTLGDEVLTPDSSRFWPVEGYAVGRGQPSFDKQYVRDWAAGTGWDKQPPAPQIPDDVVAPRARSTSRRTS